MTQRKMVRELVKEESPGCWPDDINQIIKRLEELKSIRKLQPSETLSLEFDEYFHYAYDSHSTPMFLLYHTRLENDAEFQDRTAREQQQQQEREARERAEFERLSKKFK